MEKYRQPRHKTVVRRLLPGLLVVAGLWLMQPAFGNAEKTLDTDKDQTSKANVADVLSVKVSGKTNAYQFSVEIKSPDTGCDQYADWWEVLTEKGELVYRRILAHSHTTEQPFVRSGGPVAIEPEAVVIVRAHMHPEGYGGKAMKGSVQTGFEEVELAADFANEVETAPPQPDGCAF